MDKNLKKKIVNLSNLIGRKDQNLGKKILKIQFNNKNIKEIAFLVFKILNC